MRAWVLVEDDQGKKVGFGASLLSVEKKETKAILYGPHSREPQVVRALISEMSSYWRSNDVDTMRILRISEFHDSIINQFSLKLIHSTIRYVKS
jgi:hypothetical protein